MNEQEKQRYFHTYNQQIHVLGRITLIVSMLLLIGVPFIFGIMFDAMPDGKGFLSGILKVGVIYYPVAIVEFLVYTPMLGAGGSYLGFITGNVTNLKIPCALNAQDISKAKSNTPEGEIIATLSIATSTMVTMIVLFLGALLITPLQPVLQSPVLAPAFDTVVPALFGALGLKYFLKSPRIAFVPLLAMTLLCVFVPAAIAQTSILLIPAGGLALLIGYLLYKKNML